MAVVKIARRGSEVKTFGISGRGSNGRFKGKTPKIVRQTNTLSYLALSASIWRHRAGEGGRHLLALPTPLDRSNSLKPPSQLLPNNEAPLPRWGGVLARTGDEHKLREERGGGVPPQISPFRVEGTWKRALMSPTGVCIHPKE